MCNTGIFSIFQVIPAAGFELCALNNVGERKYDVSTKVGVDVFRKEFPGVRSILCVATVVTEELLIVPTYNSQNTIQFILCNNAGHF